MVEVLVEYDYTAKEPDELTIKKGDIIKDVIQKPGGWWEGTLHDKKGVFPDNFVKILEKDSVILRNKKDSARIRQCRVVFSYNQDHEDELNLKVGDIIGIIGEEEEGWWRGRLNGKEGVFPSNFVEEIITPVQSKPKPSIRDDLTKISSEPVPALPAKPVKQLCEVRFSYKAQNEDELTLKEGEIVTIISKDCQDPGWWKGEVNGKIGVFPDNFVVLLPQNDDRKSTSKPPDSKPPSDPSAIKPPQSIATQRKSIEVKNAQSKLADAKTTPPLPGKKPLISVKKSPSGSGLFSKLKDKFADAVDGATGSRPKTDVAKEAKEISAESKLVDDRSAFDQVERRPLLGDVRANRARAPGRRLPTAVHKDEDEPTGLPNGNADHIKSEHSVKSEDSFRSEESASSENLDISSDLEGSEVKPKLREWEKHKAPWLAEMKLNQAKRTSVSPVPDLKPKSHPTTIESKPPDQEAVLSKSSQNSPAEKEVNLTDMSKSMSDIKVSPVELKPIPKPYKTPPNELENRAPPIKSKPVVSSLPSVNRHSIGSTPPQRESPSRSLAPVQKISPKPKPDQYENVTIQKTLPSLTNVTGSYSFSSSSSHTSSNFSHTLVSDSTISSSDASLSNKITKVESVSLSKFNEVLERLSKLESKCEKQGLMIEDLKNRLQVESEMRMLLQEKIMQSRVQV